MGAPKPPVVITAQMVLRAYAVGLFPMAESADDPSLFWLDPDERGVFPLDGIKVSRSLAKVVRSDRFAVDVDRDFAAVIEGCAAPASDRRDTWINASIRRLYGQLFDLGYVHTVEAYEGEELVGGLYGVALAGGFFGESMFHRRSDASKACLLHLAARLVAGGFTLLDTQFVTPHLATLGAVAVPRRAYHRRLAAAMKVRGDFDCLPKRGLTGRAVLDLLAGPGPADHPHAAHG